MLKKIILLIMLNFGILQVNLNANSDISDFEQEFQSKQVADPLSGYNKMMTNFNVALYDYAFRPIFKGYNTVVPYFVRQGARNFFDNLIFPLRFVGNLLQFKFAQAGEEAKRFGVNTIFGFFGFIDAASKTGIKKHPADVGAILAHWGVGSGFHLVLPVLGPSNLRDALSLPFDWFLSPLSYIDPTWASVGLSAYSFGNELSFRTDEIDEIYYNTPNLYPFLRDAYEARRNKMAQ